MADEDGCDTLHVHNDFTIYDMEEGHKRKGLTFSLRHCNQIHFVDSSISGMYLSELALCFGTVCRRG